MSAPYAVASTVFGMLGGFALGTTWPLHPLNADMRWMGRVLAVSLISVSLASLVVGGA